MKKRLAMGIICAAIMMAGCGSGETDSPGTAGGQDQTQSESEESQQSEEETSDDDSSAEELLGDLVYESPLGYSLTYNADLFEVVSSDSADSFDLIGQDYETEVPVHVSISKCEDTVDYLVEGLILQSGQDGVEAVETNFGTGGYVSQSISYSQEEAQGILYQTFHLMEVNGTVYMVEIINGDNLTPEVQNAVEVIVGTFTVTE